MTNQERAEVYLDANSLKDYLYPSSEGLHKGYQVALNLVHEDLAQIDDMTFEKLDLEVASGMISNANEKFYKKTGRRKVTFVAKEPVGLIKPKVVMLPIATRQRNFAREC
ncbi:hypothetical protein Tco_1147029 [Tanacetum coccineum]